MAAWLLVAVIACSPGAKPAPTPSPATTAVAPSPEATPTPEPAQRQEAALPAAVEEAGAATDGGNLYVMGGFNAAGASLDSVFVFDGAGWRSGPRLPLPVDHPSAASLNGQVYLAGGHSFGRDSARLYRLDGDHWTELAAMRFARGGHALVAAQGKLYALGGNTSRGNVAAVEAFDPGANAWAVVSQLPAPRNHVSGFVLGTRVCVAAGRSPNTARVDCLDAVDGSWSRLADLPRATSGGGAAAFLGGTVVVMGGEDAGESVIVDMLTFFSEGGGWTTGDSMQSPRHGIQLAVFKGRAWACGGATAPGLRPVSNCTSVANPRRVR